VNTGKTEHTRQRRPLIVRGGRLVPPVGPAVEISVAPVILGRDERCGIVLSDLEVSATHCEVRAEPEGVLVRDLGSKNGTFVGAARVREAHLTAACTLTLGSSRIGFEPSGKEHVEIASEERFGALVGVSQKTRYLFRQLRDIAPTDMSVLITGETGTGKELVAKAIHEHSPRADRPFVIVDCTTIVGTLAESQLFGYEKGAFHGAARRTDGPFHWADGGTIFLDEIGEMPIDLLPNAGGHLVGGLPAARPPGRSGGRGAVLALVVLVVSSTSIGIEPKRWIEAARGQSTVAGQFRRLALRHFATNGDAGSREGTYLFIASRVWSSKAPPPVSLWA
jgi:hypothetical protein